MALPLSVSRAARLVGVSRSVLQAMIARGELHEFEGRIDADELVQRFPQARLADAGEAERVARIREEAFGRRMRERVLPPREILAERLFAMGQELADTRRHLSAYHALVVDLGERLAGAAEGHAGSRALLEVLEQGLARILGAESETSVEAMTEILKVVSANVTVRPSGRQFLVEGNDSVLQAGLKAGLGFSYGCGSGNCGLCKARVTSGEVREIRHSDYPMSAAERAQGHILMCTHTAISDIVIEGLVASGPDDIPAQELVAKVKSVEVLGEDTRLLHLQSPRSARLRFLAGQRVTLGATLEGQDVAVSYPVASCPCDERNLLFHIARDAHDPFAVRLFADHIRAGQSLNLRGPSGRFVLDADSPRPLVFIACDTGFAPIRGLIEHAISVDDAQPITLVWLATRADGHYLANQCRAWAAALDDFRFEALAAGSPADARDDVLDRACADLAAADADFYLSGPQTFIDGLMPALQSKGARADRIFREPA
ncbi:MAG: 2Fe-2S iron-sulfur cluster-binding protein [Burkholderiaceae bacterium]